MIRSDGLRRFGNLYHLDHFCMLINLKAEGCIPVYDNKILAFHKRCLLIGLIKTGFQKHDFFFKRQPSIRKPVLTRGCTLQHTGSSCLWLKRSWSVVTLWSNCSANYSETKLICDQADTLKVYTPPQWLITPAWQVWKSPIVCNWLNIFFKNLIKSSKQERQCW